MFIVFDFKCHTWWLGHLVITSKYNCVFVLCIFYSNHSEVPERISRPYNKHVEYGLVDRCYRIPVSNLIVSINQSINQLVSKSSKNQSSNQKIKL